MNFGLKGHDLPDVFLFHPVLENWNCGYILTGGCAVLYVRVPHSGVMS